VSNRLMDACRGNDKQALDNLLDQITKGEAPLLTAGETGTLRDYLAGRFRGKRGYSERREVREIQGAMTEVAVEFVRERKLRLKQPKVAPGKRRQRGDDLEFEIINEVCEEINALGISIRGEPQSHILNAETVRDALHRSRNWREKRRKNNKLK
jgi:hypothetical protein